MNDKNLPAQQQNNSPVARLKNVISGPSVQEQFKNALGKHSDLFVASIIDIYSSDTYLQKCQPAQVVAECLKAATLKLPINKSLGFAYVVPYKNVPVFTIGYKGLIQLAMRTGLYKYINAGKVYEGELVNNDKLTGAIDLTGEKKSDTVVGYFAYIETLNGFSKTIYGTVEDLKKYGEKYSQSYGKAFSPWKKEFDAMAIKSLLRQLLSKYGIMSVEQAGTMSKALDYENNSPENRLKEDIASVDGEIIDIDPTDTPEDDGPKGDTQEEPVAEPEETSDGIKF